MILTWLSCRSQGGSSWGPWISASDFRNFPPFWNSAVWCLCVAQGETIDLILKESWGWGVDKIITEHALSSTNSHTELHSKMWSFGDDRTYIPVWPLIIYSVQLRLGGWVWATSFILIMWKGWSFRSQAFHAIAPSHLLYHCDLLMARTHALCPPTCRLRYDIWQTGRGTQPDPQPSWHAGQNIFRGVLSLWRQHSWLSCHNFLTYFVLCKVNTAVTRQRRALSPPAVCGWHFLFSVFPTQIWIIQQQIYLNLTSIKESIRNVNNSKPDNLMWIIRKERGIFSDAE